MTGAVPRNPQINKRTKVTTEETVTELTPVATTYAYTPTVPTNKSTTTTTKTYESPKQPTYGQSQQPTYGQAQQPSYRNNNNNGPQQPNYVRDSIQYPTHNTATTEYAQPERAEYAQPQREYAQPQRGQYGQPQKGEYVQQEYTQRDSMQYPATRTAQQPSYGNAAYVQPEYPNNS